MASIPGLKSDVYFGDAERPLPDWRQHVDDDESDDDDISDETVRAVVAILGFDPREDDDTTESETPTYEDLLEAVKREKGEVWKGPSGRWFTVNVNGKVVPAKSPDGTKKKPAAKKTPAPKANKADPESVKSHIDTLRKQGKASPEDAKALASMLMGLTVAQMTQVKKDLGLKASGAKADLAKKVAERALAKVATAKPEPAPEPAPAPVPDPKPAPKADPAPASNKGSGKSVLLTIRSSGAAGTTVAELRKNGDPAEVDATIKALANIGMVILGKRDDPGWLTDDEKKDMLVINGGYYDRVMPHPDDVASGASGSTKTPAPAPKPAPKPAPTPTKPGVAPEESRPADLTSKEKAAILDYSKEAYFDLNTTLRRGGSAKDMKAGFASTHASLQSAFAKAKPFEDPLTVYRGVSFMAFDPTGPDEFIAMAEKALQSGGALRLPGYSSTSMGKHAAFEGQIQLSIKVRHGLDISDLSDMKHEREFLLNHNTVIKVTRIEKISDVKYSSGWMIHAEQVLPKEAASMPAEDLVVGVSKIKRDAKIAADAVKATPPGK